MCYKTSCLYLHSTYFLHHELDDVFKSNLANNYVFLIRTYQNNLYVVLTF